jgi:hypothetical protein
MAAHHMRLSQAAGIAALNALVDAIDTGGAGKLIIYTGSEPATADTAAATEVATCVMPNPAFGNAATHGTDDAQVSLSSTASCASATGNASAVTHFRITQNNGTTVIFQGTCSATAGDDLVLNTATIVAASQVDITALTLSLPYNQA